MCKFYPLKVGRVPRQCCKEVHHSGLLWLENRLIYLNTENKTRGSYFSKALFLGGGGGGLIYGGKFAPQNRLGFYLEGNLRLKIDWASL